MTHVHAVQGRSIRSAVGGNSKNSLMKKKNKSHNSNINFLIETINIEKNDAEKLDECIRTWICKKQASEIELAELYDTLDGKFDGYRVSSNKRKRRKLIKKVVNHYAINSLRVDNQNNFFALLGSITSVVIMIYQLFDFAYDFKWDNCFYAIVFFIALFVWLRLDTLFGKNQQCRKILSLVNNEIPEMAFFLNILFYGVLGYFDMVIGEYNRWFYIIEIAGMIWVVVETVKICKYRYNQLYGRAYD